MKKTLIPACLVLLILIFVIQNNWQEFYNQSFDYLYNWECDKAIKCLEMARELEPDNPIIYWRLTFALWSKAQYGKKSKKDIEELKKMFEAAFNKGVALCDPNSVNPEILFYLGGLYGNRVLFKQAIDEQNTSLLGDVKNCREYLKQIKATDRFYYEARGYLGIFNYGPVLMSGFKKFIVKAAGYKWDEKLGLEQIKDAIAHSTHSDDIKFLYMGIFMELIKKKEYHDNIQEAIDLVEGLATKYPRNPFLKQDLESLKKYLQINKSKIPYKSCMEFFHLSTDAFDIVWYTKS